MTLAPATMPWFAVHEARLMWRDGVAMMTGGYPARRIALIIFIVVVAVVLHLMANAIVGPWVEHGVAPDKGTLVLITGSGFLFWTVMLSQALESITRAYYSRSDLDLILSSPASSNTLFAVRTGITVTKRLLRLKPSRDFFEQGCLDVGANRRDDRNDDDGNSNGDYSVFDRRCAGLVRFDGVK